MLFLQFYNVDNWRFFLSTYFLILINKFSNLLDESFLLTLKINLSKLLTKNNIFFHDKKNRYE